MTLNNAGRTLCVYSGASRPTIPNIPELPEEASCYLFTQEEISALNTFDNVRGSMFMSMNGNGQHNINLNELKDHYSIYVDDVEIDIDAHMMTSASLGINSSTETLMDKIDGIGGERTPSGLYILTGEHGSDQAFYFRYFNDFSTQKSTGIIKICSKKPTLLHITTPYVAYDSILDRDAYGEGGRFTAHLHSLHYMGDDLHETMIIKIYNEGYLNIS